MPFFPFNPPSPHCCPVLVSPDPLALIKLLVIRVRRPAAIQAAAKDALAGGPDQWAADSAHKAEAVKKGERDLWRIQFKTSLRVSPSQLWRSVVPAPAGRLFSQTVPIELLEGREDCCFFFFFLMNERIAVRCAALNSTCCTSRFTPDPPLFYQRCCKARLKVHPERRFPSFTSLSTKGVKVCIIAMRRRQKIYICPP